MQIGDIALDARDDLCRIPPLLDGFSDRCWRYMLSLEAPIYVAMSRQRVDKGGKTKAYFRCLSHKSCQQVFQCCLDGRSLTICDRADREHAAEGRLIEGLTSEQWKVFVSSEATTVEALALAYSAAKVPSPVRRRMKALLGIGGEDHETKQVTVSSGSLQAWLAGREHGSLDAEGCHSPYKFAVVGHQGAAGADDAKFMVTFVTKHWFEVCERLDSHVSGLDVSVA